VPYALANIFMRLPVCSHWSSGTWALRMVETMSQNLSCSSLSRTTRRADWELKELGTSLMATRRISSIFWSSTGLFLFSW